MNILVTGFKPFLKDSINPSERLANDLRNSLDIESLILPVEFANSFDILKARLQSKPVDFLIMLGQASGRKNICFEKIGLNWVQSEHPDENKFRPTTGKISESAPLALMSKFPIDEIYAKLKAQSLPFEISFSAGTYVCNDLYFRVLNELSLQKAVFVHVPLIEEQKMENSNQPVLAYSTQLSALVELITILRTTECI